MFPVPAELNKPMLRVPELNRPVLAVRSSRAEPLLIVADSPIPMLRCRCWQTRIAAAAGEAQVEMPALPVRSCSRQYLYDVVVTQVRRYCRAPVSEKTLEAADAAHGPTFVPSRLPRPTLESPKLWPTSGCLRVAATQEC